MNTVEPLTGAQQITLAVDQPQYDPLTIAIYHNIEFGCTAAVSRWKPSDEEREAVARGEDIYVAVMTANAFPPMFVQIGNEGLVAGRTYSNLAPYPPEK